jgi:MFS family permease
MDAAQFALVSSIFTLGGLLGALASGPISTRYGRLLAMRITSILYILGSTCETLASDIPMMIIGRLLSGVGAGASLVVVPIYISEIAPPSERGIFGVMTQITINIGLLMTQTLGYFYSKESSWRIILAAGTVIGLIQAIALFFIPESPAWTAANKDPQKALRVLQRIRGRRVDISEEIAAWDVVAPFTGAESEGLLSDPEVVGRRDSGSSKSSKPSRHIGMLEVAFDPFYRPAIIAVVGVMFAQQFCGINSVMMYSVSLLSGLFPSTSALLTIMISLVNLFMTVICAPLADKLGRKAAIIISITGMGFSSLALAFAMVFGVQILSAIAIIMFVATFAVGLGPIPFILASELVGTEARGAIQSWALSASWIATYLVAQFFPIVNTWLGGNGYVFFIFAGLALLSAIFIKLRVPETMGKKDADEVWGRVRRD